MNYEGFLTWLKTEKNIGERSARDATSRLKRALRLVSAATIDENTLEKLNETPEFLKLSMFIKSQLRRSIILYKEFSDSCK